MRLFTKALPRLALAAGAALSACGCYGAGIGQAMGGDLALWLQVAALVVGGVGLFGIGLWRTFRTSGEPLPSFAGDLAALERLVPAVRKHPEGLATLQDLIDVLFEACHRPEMLRQREMLVERGRKGGRDAA